MTEKTIFTRAKRELTQPGMSSEALGWLRNTLGTVAPRDPHTRRLGPRRYRMDLLAELCERETFVIAMSWLGSEEVPREKSKRDYADDIRLWASVAAELGGYERFSVRAMTPDIVSTWTASQKYRGASPRSMNRRLSVLSSLVDYANYMTNDSIPSPVTRFHRSKIDQDDESTETPALSVSEYYRVLDAAESIRQALVPILLYTVAGRVTECCSARMSDIKTVDGRKKLNLVRKGGKDRSWPIPDRLYQLMEMCHPEGVDSPIFLTDDGRSMDRHAVDRLLTRLGKKAGVLEGRDLTPHVFRATRLTHMHEEGVSDWDICKFADHSYIQTTLRYIRRTRDEELRSTHVESALESHEKTLERFL